jgi:hypothetical protein
VDLAAHLQIGARYGITIMVDGLERHVGPVVYEGQDDERLRFTVSRTGEAVVVDLEALVRVDLIR